MKKSLILLPLTALFLSGCMLLPGKKTSSSSSSQSGGGDEPTVDPGGGGGGDDPSGVDFVMTSGNHTGVLDFKNSSEKYKNDFPFVTKETGQITGTTGGLAYTSVDCFVGKYGDEGYLMMQNKKDSDSWSSVNGNAFFANTESLGAITAIEFVCGTKASTAQSYIITLSKTPISEAQATGSNTIGHPGNAGKPVTATVDDGYGYFAISSKDGTRNGQVGTLKVTYTIS